MPSSPEAGTVRVRAWEPAELTTPRPGGADPRPGGSGPAAFVAAPGFAAGAACSATAAALHPTRLPIFEIATAAGIPADLLAEARRAAQAAGYAAGWSAGSRDALLAAEAAWEAERERSERETGERRVRFDRAVDAVRAGAKSLELRAVPAAEQVEQLIVSAAFSIAESLVATALRDDANRGPAAVARALALAPSGDPVVIALHPADHAALTSAAGEPAASVTLGRAVELVADPSLAPGDATATCRSTAIDARISAGLARVREVLGR